jgi:sarcosine oxidase subunit gamma
MPFSMTRKAHGAMAESPLSGAALPAGVTEVPFLTQINVRAAEVPSVPAGSGFALLRLGPDEWLAVGPPLSPLRIDGASLVDVSAQRTTLDLDGPRVRDLLALGCSLDLHPRVFAIGDCAQTTLAHTPVILLRRERGFRILVRASFAAHLAAWLVDATTEFALMEALP